VATGGFKEKWASQPIMERSVELNKVV